jgi:hypothetical protein
MNYIEQREFLVRLRHDVDSCDKGVCDLGRAIKVVDNRQLAATKRCLILSKAAMVVASVSVAIAMATIGVLLCR